MSQHLTQDPNDEDVSIIVVLPDKRLLCHIDGKPCQPDVQFGDSAKCRFWWGGQAVHDKCEARKKEMAERQ